MYESRVNPSIDTKHTASLQRIEILEVDEPNKFDQSVKYDRRINRYAPKIEQVEVDSSH